MKLQHGEKSLISFIKVHHRVSELLYMDLKYGFLLYVDEFVFHSSLLLKLLSLVFLENVSMNLHEFLLLSLNACLECMKRH